MKKLAIAILAVSTLGAASSYVYDREPTPEVWLSGAQATVIFQAFKAHDGVWAGTPAEAHACILRRAPDMTPDKTRPYGVRCYGDKTVPADSLPEGATNIRVIN